MPCTIWSSPASLRARRDIEQVGEHMITSSDFCAKKSDDAMMCSPTCSISRLALRLVGLDHIVQGMARRIICQKTLRGVSGKSTLLRITTHPKGVLVEPSPQRRAGGSIFGCENCQKVLKFTRSCHFGTEQDGKSCQS